MKILIVDDSRVKRKALAYLIEKEGHEVIEAGDGQDGLKKARAYMPDIIISDLLMPRMDGFNFLRNIKKDERLRTVPFLFYSATYQGEKERAFALSLGASGFIEDLGRPETFWQELQEIIAGGKEPQVMGPIIEGDEKFLENYGHIVASKLEEKVRELEDEVDERRRTEETLKESEEKFSKAFYMSPAGMTITRISDGKFIDVNDTFLRMFEFRRDEVIGHRSVELNMWTQVERDKVIKKLLESGELRDIELHGRSKTGRIITLLLSSNQMVLKGETCHIAIMIDISERKKVEEALLGSELRFRTSVETMLEAFGIYSAIRDEAGRIVDFEIVYVNPAACSANRMTKEEQIGKRLLEILPAHRNTGLFDDYCQVVETGRPFAKDSLVYGDVYGKQRLTRAFDIRAAKLGDGFIATWRDITDRMKAEEELRLLYQLVQEISLAVDFTSALEVSLRKICETTGWVMGEAWVPSSDGSHLECSPAWYGKVGLDRLKKFRKASEGFRFLPGVGIPGRVWSSRGAVWDVDVTLDANFPRASYAAEAGLKAGMAIPVLSEDQVVAVMEFFVMEPREEDKRLVGLVSTIAAYLGNLFQYKKTEEELRKLYHAVEQSPVSVFITDDAFNIQYINPKFIEVTGYSREEAIGMKPDILTSGTAVISGTEWRGEFLARKKNGDPFWEYATISPVRNDKGEITNFIGIHEDITERRKIEDQLRHSQKLEAIGQLVGGIAHDFNNILTAIIGFAGIMKMRMKEGDPQIGNVEQVLEAAERGASLTRSLLVFGRKQAIYPRPVNLSEIIENMGKLISRLVGEDIELNTVISDGELYVTADPLQIEQVLINLSTNARDAMSRGGVLTIEAGRERFDGKFIKTHGYGEPGEYALITVSDTGEGMDEETRERIFDPFFTTKEVGKGTGLGLAIVYGIVKQHNGFINVYSEVGKGTTFKIYLPMTSPVALETLPVGAEKPTASAVSARGTETVLVAEDDKNVRRLSRTLLETFGYTVIEAVNGDDAVQKYRENKEMIKLLILDVIMPRKNGREAYEEIRKAAPDARVIFVSGYTADVMHKKGIIDDGMVFVSKPISPTDFMKKVREVLDR